MRTLSGGGCTQIAPLMQIWMEAYQRQTGVVVEYQPWGSGGGIRFLSEGKIAFAVADRPLSPQDSAALGDVLQIPLCYVTDDIRQKLYESGDIEPFEFESHRAKRHDE